MTVPSSSTTASTASLPRTSVTETPVSTRVPCRSWIAVSARPIRSPTPRTNGVGSASTIVTSSPRLRATAAISEPMKPAPITVTRGEP